MGLILLSSLNSSVDPKGALLKVQDFGLCSRSWLFKVQSIGLASVVGPTCDLVRNVGPQVSVSNLLNQDLRF